MTEVAAPKLEGWGHPRVKRLVGQTKSHFWRRRWYGAIRSGCSRWGEPNLPRVLTQEPPARAMDRCERCYQTFRYLHPTGALEATPPLP